MYFNYINNIEQEVIRLVVARYEPYNRNISAVLAFIILER